MKTASSLTDNSAHFPHTNIYQIVVVERHEEVDFFVICYYFSLVKKLKNV